MKELIKFKVMDGDVVHEFSFVEPTKGVLKEAEIVNATTYAECLRQGYMTTQEAAKIHSERGGIFTKDEEEDFKKALAEYLIEDKKVKDLGTDSVDQILVDKVASLKDRVLFYYNRQDSIFELTAERKAREVTLWHYALSCVYKDGKNFFDGRDFKNRQKLFDESPSTLKEDVLKRGIWYATAFVSGVKFDDVPFPESFSKTPVAQ